jgi:hypothetical protein
MQDSEDERMDQDNWSDDGNLEYGFPQLDRF